MAVNLRAYLSPTLVLLALDWDKGKTQEDFLGFAIKRKPGFLAPGGQSREPESWLPNRVTFKGPKAAEAAQANGQIIDAAKLANMDLFHRTRKNRDVIPGAHFSPATVPVGFKPELVVVFPGEQAQDFGAVVIHHKFVVIDAEGDNPAPGLG